MASRHSNQRKHPSPQLRARASSRGQTAPMQDLQVLRSLLTRIVERLGPEEIWLFGSRAEGRPRPVAAGQRL